MSSDNIYIGNKIDNLDRTITLHFKDGVSVLKFSIDGKMYFNDEEIVNSSMLFQAINDITNKIKNISLDDYVTKEEAIEKYITLKEFDSILAKYFTTEEADKFKRLINDKYAELKQSLKLVEEEQKKYISEKNCIELFNKELEPLKQEIKRKENEIAGLNNIIKSLNINIEDQNKTIKNFREKIIELNKEVANFKSKIADLEKTIISLRGKISPLESEITRLNRKISDLNSTISSLKKEIASLEGRNSKLNKEIDDLKRENSSLHDELADFKKIRVLSNGKGDPSPTNMSSIVENSRGIYNGSTKSRSYTEWHNKEGENYYSYQPRCHLLKIKNTSGEEAKINIAGSRHTVYARSDTYFYLHAPKHARVKFTVNPALAGGQYHHDHFYYSLYMM